MINPIKSTPNMITLALTGQVSDDSVTPIINTISNYINEDEKPIIKILINTLGGYVHSAYDLLTLMNEYKAQGGIIKTSIGGSSYSAGSYIGAMGSKGEREILSHANIMIHNPYTLSENAEAKKSTETTRKSIVNLLSNITNLPEEKLVEMMNKTTFINSKDAIKYGFADKIINITNNVQTEILNQKTNNNNMDNNNVLCNALDLVENANTNAILNSINNLKNRLTNIEKERNSLENELDLILNENKKLKERDEEVTNTLINQEIKMAISNGKILDTEENHYIKIGKKIGLDDLRDHFNNMRQTVRTAEITINESTSSDLLNKSIQELEDMQILASLEKNYTLLEEVNKAIDNKIKK